MNEREKARRALKKLEEIEAKRSEQRRLERELRHSLERQAYTERELYLHPQSGVSLPSSELAALREGRCGRCGGKFYSGERVLEYLDDAGSVVARYHLGCS